MVKLFKWKESITISINKAISSAQAKKSGFIPCLLSVSFAPWFPNLC